MSIIVLGLLVGDGEGLGRFTDGGEMTEATNVSRRNRKP